MVEPGSQLNPPVPLDAFVDPVPTPVGITGYHLWVAMTLRLSDEEADALRAQAKRENRSMQEVAREAIRVYVSRRVQLREQALRHIVDEDRDLLDRLAQ